MNGLSCLRKARAFRLLSSISYSVPCQPGAGNDVARRRRAEQIRADGGSPRKRLAACGTWCQGVPVPADYFTERIAEKYEAYRPDLFETAAVDPVVAFLADLAGEGSAALEFGIGTGRIALPLSQRGIRVHGIDLSPAMVARLRAKPGADAIGVTIGGRSASGLGAIAPLGTPGGCWSGPGQPVPAVCPVGVNGSRGRRDGVFGG